jgi:hypothetical protein
MGKTALQLVQEFADKRGLPRPANLENSLEKSSRQFLALLNWLVRDLSRFSFETQKVRKSWTGVAAELQGELTTLFGADFRFLVPGTVYNVSTQIPVYGPVSDAEWQALKSTAATGPEHVSWVAGGSLYLLPAPNGTDIFSAIVRTQSLVYDGSESTRELVQANLDSFLVPDAVVLAGLDFIWNKEKGEAWGEDYSYYMGLIAQYREPVSPNPLQLDLSRPVPRPGILIPAGSWGV